MISGDDAMEVTLTKVEAARQQMRAAIELWFRGDHVPAQALAYAAYEIVHRYCKRNGVHGLIYDTKVIADKKQRNEINLVLKDVPNWIKHAEIDQEFEGTKTLVPMHTQLFLMVSCIGLMRTKTIKLRAHEAALIYWHVMHHADWFPEKIVINSVPPDKDQEFRKLAPEHFLPAFLNFWSEGGVYVVN